MAVDDRHVSLLGLRVTGGGWVQPLADNTIPQRNSSSVTILQTFVRIGDWRGSTFGASNHKSTRAMPGSFASGTINKQLPKIIMLKNKSQNIGTSLHFQV